MHKPVYQFKTEGLKMSLLFGFILANNPSENKEGILLEGKNSQISCEFLLYYSLVIFKSKADLKYTMKGN